MTDGPYNESIRGPGNRGLGGIWALLNSIAGGLGSLPQIAADMRIIAAQLEGDGATIRQRLTFLSGATAVPANLFDANGLPGYLSYTIASRATRNNLGASAYEQVASINDTISLLTQSLYGLETLGGDRGQLPRLRDELVRLNNSLGIAATSTPDFTALDWLAIIADGTTRSADCCEDANAPPAPGLNPPPTGFCVPANAVRQVSWNAIGTQLVGGVVMEVWRPVFDFSGGVNAPLSGTGAAGSEPTAPALRFSANIDITFCISWDFTGNTAPTAFGRYFGTNQATTESNQDLSGPLNAPSTLTVGGLSDDRNTCDGVERYGAHNFAFPVGVTPSLNVFLGLTQSRGCPQ